MICDMVINSDYLIHVVDRKAKTCFQNGKCFGLLFDSYSLTNIKAYYLYIFKSHNIYIHTGVNESSYVAVQFLVWFEV